jgi:hypothetical protein
LAALAAACGPIGYVNAVTREASSEVEAAHAVGAANDPEYRYWITLADEYLTKAREQAAHADFQAANRFGRKASHAARRARERAGAGAANAAPAPAAVRGSDDGDGDGFSDLGGDDAEVGAADGSEDESGVGEAP